MASPWQGNDGGRRRRRARRPAAHETGGAGEAQWLWGAHPVAAALANPDRALKRLAVSAERAALARQRAAGRVEVEVCDGQTLARLTGPGAVHQGWALLAAPPPPRALDDLAQPAAGLLLMLDEVTDPQNLGAIWRSAAAFGARGLILQDRRAPPVTGAVAKAAAGAVDQVPCVREVNLSRALERLERLGWRSVGLSGDAQTGLAEALDGGPTVLVLGSEGEGLRRLVAEHCDILARIPMPGGFESLNVSAAAAVALYEASRTR